MPIWDPVEPVHDDYGMLQKFDWHAPYRRWVAITPSDTEYLPFRPRAIFVGGAGKLKMEDEYGNVVIFNGLTAGSHIDNVRPIRIHASDTTTTGIVILA